MAGGPEIAVPLALIAGVGAGVYTAITGNNVTDFILSKFMWGSEQLEALVGTTAQITGSVIDPKIFGTPDEVLGNLRATGNLVS